jgi:hypothetical protein
VESFLILLMYVLATISIMCFVAGLWVRLDEPKKERLRTVFKHAREVLLFFFYGPRNLDLTCPHCLEKSHVRTKRVDQK